MKMPPSAALDLPLTVPPTAECLAGSATFVEAVRARNWGAVARTLHPSVELHASHDRQPLRGEYDVICALDCLCSVPENFRALALLGSCERPVLHFTGGTADGGVDGVMLLEVDELGLVERITVMQRPSLRASAVISA